MGRKPLPIGAWGLIRTHDVGQDARGRPVRVRAVASFRDFDGRTRQVEASGRTATMAKQNLRTILQHRSTSGRSGELTSLTRFSEAAEMWMERLKAKVRDEVRSPATVDTYERQLRLHVLPALGQVRLGEATTPLIDRVVGSIKESVSGSTAKTCRSVISGVMGLAVRHGALSTNPVREVDRVTSRPRREPRALTADECSRLLRRLAEDDLARRHDLLDLVLFMLATGARIGEALAVVWSEVDFSAGTVDITSTLTRIRGEGLLRKSTKTRAGTRTLTLPTSAVVRLRRRFMTGARLEQPVFPSATGSFRDPTNVRRSLRAARVGDDLAWVTSHTFRKTAATILDDAALSARMVADQLGHARPSMTQDVYLGRGSTGSRAAAALETALAQAEAELENHGKTMGEDQNGGTTSL